MGGGEKEKDKDITNNNRGSRGQEREEEEEKKRSVEKALRKDERKVKRMERTKDKGILEPSESCEKKKTCKRKTDRSIKS